MSMTCLRAAAVSIPDGERSSALAPNKDDPRCASGSGASISRGSNHMKKLTIGLLAVSCALAVACGSAKDNGQGVGTTMGALHQVTMEKTADNLTVRGFDDAGDMWSLNVHVGMIDVADIGEPQALVHGRNVTLSHDGAYAQYLHRDGHTKIGDGIPAEWHGLLSTPEVVSALAEYGLQYTPRVKNDMNAAYPTTFGVDLTGYVFSSVGTAAANVTNESTAIQGYGSSVTGNNPTGAVYMYHCVKSNSTGALSEATRIWSGGGYGSVQVCRNGYGAAGLQAYGSAVSRSPKCIWYMINNKDGYHVTGYYTSNEGVGHDYGNGSYYPLPDWQAYNSSWPGPTSGYVGGYGPYGNGQPNPTWATCTCVAGNNSGVTGDCYGPDASMNGRYISYPG